MPFNTAIVTKFINSMHIDARPILQMNISIAPSGLWYKWYHVKYSPMFQKTSEQRFSIALLFFAAFAMMLLRDCPVQHQQVEGHVRHFDPTPSGTNMIHHLERPIWSEDLVVVYCPLEHLSHFLSHRSYCEVWWHWTCCKKYCEFPVRNTKRSSMF